MATKTFTITATITRVDGGTVDVTDQNIVDMLANQERECNIHRSNPFYNVANVCVVT